MAIFSLNHKSVGRTTHKAGTAAAHIRYITRAKTARIFLSNGFDPQWPPGKIASSIKKAEELDRKNARVIDKIMVALPLELDEAQREELVVGFIKEITNHKVPWIAAFHDQGKDSSNPHCHIVIRDRHLETGRAVCALTENGSTQKLRILWENSLNSSLKKAGFKERVSCRSLKEQGVDRKPQIHVGPKSKSMLERGINLESRDIVNNKGREVRYSEIDQGKSRYEHNEDLKSI